MNDTRLPDTPSALIRLALGDLRKCEADPRYKINFGEWHNPTGQQCEVCLAGAVLAKTCGMDPRTGVNWAAIGRPTYYRCIAMDNFRRGEIYAGLRYMRFAGALQESPTDEEVALQPALKFPKYSEDPEAFYTVMSALADEFEEAGL
jgi:hypothetical protein